jgi:UDP-N-acetylmuramyl pentapeptide synthase
MYSLLAALAVVAGEGHDVEKSIARLEKLRPLPGRFQPLAHSSGAWLLRDDFKSPLESVECALRFLAEVPAERRIALLGDVTEPPQKQGPLYKALGKLAGSVCDRVLLIGHAEEYYRPGLYEAGHSLETVHRCHRDIQQAILLLRQQLRAGDVVLIKGRHDQRLGRIALALCDGPVQCSIPWCRATNLECEDCWMLNPKK